MSEIFILSYKVGNTIYKTGCKTCADCTVDITDDGERLTVTLNPKKPTELVGFSLKIPFEFSPEDVFFANGYQSWTTSREYSSPDVVRGMIPLARVSDFTSHLAAISSDEGFIKYSEKPGEFHSHCYTYIRNGKKVNFYGSLSERAGYTYFTVKMQKNYFAVNKDLKGKIIDKPTVILDMVYFTGGYDEVFDRYFSMMKMPETKSGCMSGYTSWYNYFQNINEDIILRDLDGLDKVSDKVSIFQIDDGYETYVGDWIDPNPKKFPHGMRYIAEKVHEKGYKAGLWLAPFNCQIASKTAKEHPDWLVKDKKGRPIIGCAGWGGAYILDIYNEEARAYIKYVFDTVLGAWGYDMVKLDFLYSECIEPRLGKSRGEIMCDAMDFLRECVGEKLLLGCGVPIGPALGIVDACRISCDVDLVYGGKYYNKLHVNNEIPSAQCAIINSLFRRHLNGRAFMNDPDVFFLRDNNLTFTKEQKLLLGGINNLCGNVLFVSDNAGDYDDETTELLKKLFTKTDKRVTLAEYVSENIIRVETEENGKFGYFEFDITNGIVMSRG